MLVGVSPALPPSRGFPREDGSPPPPHPPAAGGRLPAGPGLREVPGWEVCSRRRGEAAGALRRWVWGGAGGAAERGPLTTSVPSAGGGKAAASEPPRPAAQLNGPWGLGRGGGARPPPWGRPRRAGPLLGACWGEDIEGYCFFLQQSTFSFISPPPRCDAA